MHKIWGRALEVRSQCTCHFCAPSSPGLARRANTLPIRQRIRFRDTVAFYSTLLGAAAFYDGVSKHKKRQDLDNAIKDAQAEIEELGKDQETRLEALGRSSLPSPDNLQPWGTQKGTTDYHAETLRRIQSLVVERNPILPSTSASRDANHQLTVRRGWRKQWRRPGQAMRVEEFFDVPVSGSHTGKKESLSLLNVFNVFLQPARSRMGRPPGEAWADTENPIPSRRIRLQREAAMARLVFCLISELFTARPDNPEAEERRPYIHLDLPDGKHVRLSSDDISDISHNIEELTFRLSVLRGLRASPHAMSLIVDTPSPHYEVAEETEREAEIARAAQQNDTLIDIFANSTSLDELLSALCTAILGQRVAPNIHTYNILIVKFQDLGLRQAVRHAIGALLSSAILQNEITHVAILNYYLFYSSPYLFRGYCNVMQGVAGQGVGRADYDVKEPEALLNPSHLSVSFKDLTYPRTGPDTPSQVLRTASMNQEVYEATIVGLLHIREFANAMRQYSSMLANGFRHSVRIHEAMLCASVDQEDWELGCTVWEHLQSASESVSTLSYYWMLQLCSRFANQKRFNEIMSQGLQSGALKDRLYITNFWLDDKRKIGVRTWKFETSKLRQHIWVPGLPNMDYGTEFCENKHLPNLYTMLLAQYIAVFEARKQHLLWLDHDEDLVNKARWELDNGLAQHEIWCQVQRHTRPVSSVERLSTGIISAHLASEDPREDSREESTSEASQATDVVVDFSNPPGGRERSLSSFFAESAQVEDLEHTNGKVNASISKMTIDQTSEPELPLEALNLLDADG